MSKKRNEDTRFDQTIGMYLRDCRTKKNISLQQIADKTGVTKMTVSRWETGEVRMYAHSLKDYCDCIDISISDVFDYVEKHIS